jgi:hypothetical protein
MSKTPNTLKLCDECKSISESPQSLANGRTVQEQIFLTDVGYEYQRTREEIKISADKHNCVFCKAVEESINEASDECITSLNSAKLWCPPSTSVFLRLRYQSKTGCLSLYLVEGGYWRSVEERDKTELCISSWHVQAEQGKYLSQAFVS